MARKAAWPSHQLPSCNQSPKDEIFGYRNARGGNWRHFQHPVNEMISVFGPEVWNYKYKNAFISFPINQSVELSLFSETNTLPHSVRYECEPGALPNATCNDENYGKVFESNTHITSNSSGVDEDKIQINVIIVNNKYVIRLSDGKLFENKASNPGEIIVEPKQKGFLIYQYAKNTFDPIVTAHEIGHALLTFHTDLAASNNKNIMYPYLNSNDKLKNYLGPMISFNNSPGGFNPFIQHFLLWRTSEGETVPSTGE